MHMIGISGRCAIGARAPPAASTPSPSTPAHVEGARSVSASKTGCQWCRALVSETCVAMRWAYLILVSGLRLDFVDPRLEPTDFLPNAVPLFSERAHMYLVLDDGPNDEHDDDPASDKDRQVWPDGTVSHNDECNGYEYPNGERGECDDAESPEVNSRPTSHGWPPAIWTILAFPRPTRISAIVFGSVTTSSFLSRYVVSIPANGGKSSSTWTSTWSLRLGGTATPFLSSARTTFIRSGSFFAPSGFRGTVGGEGGFTSSPRSDPPNASARLFVRRATMLSKRPRSWAGRFGTSTSAPLARLDARSASFRSR